MGLMPADADEAMVGGELVRYYAAGSGPPVVLLHGLGGSAAVWHRNLPALKRRFRVFAPELWGADGHGESTPEAGVRFVTGFLDAVGCASAHLVGGSLGGFMAGSTAIAEPGRVRSLTLIGTAGLGRRIAFSQRLLTLPLVGEAMFRPSRRRVRRMLAMLIAEWDADAERLVDELYAVRCQPGVPGRMLEVLRSGINLLGVKRSTRLLPALCDVRTPTLLVWGSRDPLFPIEDARRAARVLRGAELLVVEGSGHWPYLEAPETFNPALLGFLGRAEEALVR
ncbi:MAG: alpha/beta fold hydrolase [Chloroflexi bacterium]|nr:alpha/beta fold hydrolase [Chloroflexota bacterium]